MAQPLSLLVTITFFGAILVSGVSGTYGGGAGSIEKTYYLKELGEYAVACHNLVSKHQLTFQKVIQCDDLPGLTHKLTIQAADGSVSHTYEAVVCYKPLIKFKKLISFKLA
ncbi:putative Cystatin domain-containing protein [Helianthus anomalus]